MEWCARASHRPTPLGKTESDRGVHGASGAPAGRSGGGGYDWDVVLGAVLSRQECSAAPLSSVGAKAATLARIARAGIAVPEFCVIPSTAFQLHLRENGIAWPGSLNDTADLERLSGVREEIGAAPVPDSSMCTAPLPCWRL